MTICALPGCDQPIERPGQAYCSRQHRQLAYVHKKRHGDDTEKPAAGVSVYAKSAGEVSQQGSGVDKAPVDALCGAVAGETAIESPPVAVLDRVAEETAVEGVVIAVLGDRWRVVLDDSPTPRYRQWILQRSFDGKRGIEWRSMSFCQTRSGVVQAIGSKVCKDALMPIPAAALATIATLPERTYASEKSSVMERLERDDMLIGLLMSNQDRQSRVFGQVRVEPLLYGMLLPQAAAANEINLAWFDKAGGKLVPLPKEDFNETVRRQLRDELGIVPVSEGELASVLRKKGFLLWGDSYDPNKAKKAAAR